MAFTLLTTASAQRFAALAATSGVGACTVSEATTGGTCPWGTTCWRGVSSLILKSFTIRSRPGVPPWSCQAVGSFPSRRKVSHTSRVTSSE